VAKKKGTSQKTEKVPTSFFARQVSTKAPKLCILVCSDIQTSILLLSDEEISIKFFKRKTTVTTAQTVTDTLN
jgi:hypothetical protein